MSLGCSRAGSMCWPHTRVQERRNIWGNVISSEFVTKQRLVLFATEVMVVKKMVEVTVPRIKALTAAATTTAVSSAIVSLLPAGYVVRVSWVFVISVTGAALASISNTETLCHRRVS